MCNYTNGSFYTVAVEALENNLKKQAAYYIYTVN